MEKANTLLLIILGGDSNQIIGAILDRLLNKRSSVPRDRAGIQLLMENMELTDISRMVNPGKLHL